jgi:hypothetical protein
MSLVDQHPLVIAADEQIAALAKRRAEFEAHTAVLAAGDNAAQQAYDKALDAAMRDGAPAPEPLRLRLNGADIDARHGFMTEQQRLSEVRRQAVADAYDDVLAQARPRAAKLIRDARPTVVKLAAVMGEISELLAAIQTARDAGNSVTSADGHRAHYDSRLTVETFIKLALSGGDPIGLLDLAGSPQAQFRNADPLFQPRNTGMSGADIQQLIEDSPGGERVRA